MAFSDWSIVPATNATAPGINWAEGQLPGTVNNSARQMMADLAAERDSVSVRGFGAVGDGVADDTAAIQAAITFAGTRTPFFPAKRNVTVHLPAGDYLISAGLVSNFAINFAGEGVHATRLICTTGGAAFAAYTLQTATAPIWGARTSGISVFCKGGATACSGFVGKSTLPYTMSQCLWQDLFVQDAGGIDYDFGTDNGHYNNHFRNCKAYFSSLSTTKTFGLRTSGGAYNSYSDCDLEGTGPAGYAFYLSGLNNFFRNISVDGCCYIDNPGGSGHGLTVESIVASPPVSPSAVIVNRASSLYNLCLNGVDPARCPQGVQFNNSGSLLSDFNTLGTLQPTYPVFLPPGITVAIVTARLVVAATFPMEVYCNEASMSGSSFVDSAALTARREGVKVVANGAKPTAATGLRGQIVLERGTAAHDDRAYVCRLNAAGAYEWKALGNACGSQAFTAATTAAVTLATPEVDTAYYVALAPSAANGGCWITAKATTGFTINFNAAFTGTVDWSLTR